MPLAFDHWFDALEKRHTRTLTFQEIRRSVQALSSLYVERREHIGNGSAFSGAGKRAAFGLFFGPLHFLLVREIVRALKALNGMETAIEQLIDLGCGTGSAGLAWASECDPALSLLGVDCNAWALEESHWSYRTLGLRGKTRRAAAESIRIPSGAAVVAAFTVNELDPDSRARLLANLLPAHNAPILIVEPIAKRVAEWWPAWTQAFCAAGGRADEWRFQVALPEKLALLDRAAHLDHRELTARSLWLG